MHIFTDKISTGLEGSIIFAYPVHGVQLNFREEYRNSLIQDWNSLESLVPAETEKSKI